MQLITLDQARMQTKADGDDDELLVTYGNAAEAYCARLANRSLFASAAAKQAAVATVGTRMAAAYSAYDAAITQAEASDDDRVIAMMTAAAQRALDDVTTACEKDVNGLALDEAPDMAAGTAREAVEAAVLMLVAHFYATRPTVLTGQGAAAVEVPHGTADIMAHYRWIGPEYV